MSTLTGSSVGKRNDALIRKKEKQLLKVEDRLLELKDTVRKTSQDLKTLKESDKR